MIRRLIIFGAVAMAAATLTAGSDARSNALCRSVNDPLPFCVYQIGKATATKGEYAVTLHFYNDSGQPVKGEVNAFVQASMDLDTVPSHGPARIVLSPVKYITTGAKFNKLARGMRIGIPGGLKPHQDLTLKLVYEGLVRPSENSVGGVFFSVQFWKGALMPNRNAPITTCSNGTTAPFQP